MYINLLCLLIKEQLEIHCRDNYNSTFVRVKFSLSKCTLYFEFLKTLLILSLCVMQASMDKLQHCIATDHFIIVLAPYYMCNHSAINGSLLQLVLLRRSIV